MLSVIKTAIVTIIISFISGVLLDYYKNYAPRIVCNIGKAKILRKNDKKVKIYSITIRNISKKTIHDLNINITADCENLKLHETKITSGLRFDISENTKMYNINIPFLSNNDGFLTKIILENPNELASKPIINLKSPENFKRVDSVKSKKEHHDYALIKNLNEILEKVFYNNRKIILSLVAVLIVIFIGIVAGERYGSSISNQNKVYKNAGVENSAKSTSEEGSNESTTSYNEDESTIDTTTEYNKEQETDSSYDDTNNSIQPAINNNYDNSGNYQYSTEENNNTTSTTEQGLNQGSTENSESTTSNTTGENDTTEATTTNEGNTEGTDNENTGNTTDESTDTSSNTTDTTTTINGNSTVKVN